MWTVVYMAQSRQIAENVRQLLEKNSLIVRIRSLNNEEASSDCYELLVPESELQQALSIIIDANF